MHGNRCMYVFQIWYYPPNFWSKKYFPEIGKQENDTILGVHFNPKNEEIYNLILMHSDRQMHSMNKKLNNYHPSHHQLPSETDMNSHSWARMIATEEYDALELLSSVWSYYRQIQQLQPQGISSNWIRPCWKSPKNSFQRLRPQPWTGQINWR